MSLDNSVMPKIKDERNPSLVSGTKADFLMKTNKLGSVVLLENPVSKINLKKAKSLALKPENQKILSNMRKSHKKTTLSLDLISLQSKEIERKQYPSKAGSLILAPTTPKNSLHSSSNKRSNFKKPPLKDEDKTKKNVVIPKLVKVDEVFKKTQNKHSSRSALNNVQNETERIKAIKNFLKLPPEKSASSTGPTSDRKKHSPKVSEPSEGSSRCLNSENSETFCCQCCKKQKRKKEKIYCYSLKRKHAYMDLLSTKKFEPLLSKTDVTDNYEDLQVNDRPKPTEQNCRQDFDIMSLLSKMANNIVSKDNLKGIEPLKSSEKSSSSRMNSIDETKLLALFQEVSNDTLSSQQEIMTILQQSENLKDKIQNLNTKIEEIGAILKSNQPSTTESNLPAYYDNIDIFADLSKMQREASVMNIMTEILDVENDQPDGLKDSTNPAAEENVSSHTLSQQNAYQYCPLEKSDFIETSYPSLKVNLSTSSLSYSSGIAFDKDDLKIGEETQIDSVAELLLSKLNILSENEPEGDKSKALPSGPKSPKSQNSAAEIQDKSAEGDSAESNVKLSPSAQKTYDSSQEVYMFNARLRKVLEIIDDNI